MSETQTQTQTQTQEKQYHKPKPTYADTGREARVKESRWAELYINEHCLANDSRHEPFADDRLNTKESCQKPDLKINGVPTEVKMWNKWVTGKFSESHRGKPLQLPIVEMRKKYPDGLGLMVNLEGSWAAWVPFSREPDDIVKTKSYSHASGYMWAAQYAPGHFKEFPLKKLEKPAALIAYEAAQKEFNDNLADAEPF